MRSRWIIAILITVAIAIAYLDRQTLAVSVKAIQVDIPLSDKDFGHLQAAFFFAYALMYMGGGRLMDALGTRRGFLLMAVWWSLACAAHGLATGVLMLVAGRLMARGEVVVVHGNFGLRITELAAGQPSAQTLGQTLGQPTPLLSE